MFKTKFKKCIKKCSGSFQVLKVVYSNPKVMTLKRGLLNNKQGGLEKETSQFYDPLFLV